MSDFVGTVFDAFGGYVDCNHNSSKCAEYVDDVNAVGCYRFLNSEVSIPDGSWCACKLGEGQYGIDCKSFTPLAYLRGLGFGINILWNIILASYVLKVFYNGKKYGCLRRNAATVNLCFCFLSAICLSLWSWCCVTYHYLKDLDNWYLTEYSISFTGIFTCAMMSNVVLVWTRIMRKTKSIGKHLGKGKLERRLVRFGIFVSGISNLFFLVILRNGGFSAMFSALYFLILGILYELRARQMKKMFEQSVKLVSEVEMASNYSNEKRKDIQMLHKIIRCKNRVQLGIAIVVASLVFYAWKWMTWPGYYTDAKTYVSSWSTLTMLLGTSLVIHSITFYCAAPLESRIIFHSSKSRRKPNINSVSPAGDSGNISVTSSSPSLIN